jgi:hypothetical protein
MEVLWCASGADVNAVLISGRPPTEECTAVIVHTQPLGIRDGAGEDLYALTVRLVVEGAPVGRIRIGSHVPAAASPLLATGTALPARWIAHEADGELIIDWRLALARAGA